VAPITFSCRDTFATPPEEVAARILDLANWTSFQGYLFLPGIKAAEFDALAPDVVGTRIRVTNTDGSRHVEEVVEWEPVRRVRLQFKEFSAPLSWLATTFFETWEFERKEGRTHATRSFEMHASSFLTWPVLWLISFFLKAAIAKHMRQMREAAG
jgi:hypothetical protein